MQGTPDPGPGLEPLQHEVHPGALHRQPPAVDPEVVGARSRAERNAR